MANPIQPQPPGYVPPQSGNPYNPATGDYSPVNPYQKGPPSNYWTNPEVIKSPDGSTQVNFVDQNNLAASSPYAAASDPFQDTYYDAATKTNFLYDTRLPFQSMMSNYLAASQTNGGGSASVPTAMQTNQSSPQYSSLSHYLTSTKQPAANTGNGVSSILQYLSQLQPMTTTTQMPKPA
jgi:hypothetical protein